MPGMTCASCAARVESGLAGIAGVDECRVNFATETGPPSTTTPRGHRPDVVRGRGRRPRLLGARRAEARATPRPTSTRATSVPRLAGRGRAGHPGASLISMVPALMFDGWQWVAFVLSTPVILWSAWPFHRATLVNLRHGAATMDTLVSLGTLAA